MDMDSSSSSGTPRAATASMYVDEASLAKQLAYRNTDDVRLTTVCKAASDAIDYWCSKPVGGFLPDVPAGIQEVALSLAVDIWKQPDATFGIMGLSETGPVRVARDLVQRYDGTLINFYSGWGIA